jgi:hypothetical protein
MRVNFVFDLLYNNSTDIQPEIHSTDTQGTNNLNFALLHVFGSSRFTPRYKDIYDKVRNSLIAFHHPSRYGDAIIKPMRKIRKDLIVGEWDECRAEPKLRHGSVIWRVEGGEGQFGGASGLITSNFTISEAGEVIDRHFGVIFVR